MKFLVQVIKSRNQKSSRATGRVEYPLVRFRSSQFLAQKCITLTFINFTTMLESGLHDGVCRTLLDDLHKKLLSNEYGHVMNHYVNFTGT